MKSVYKITGMLILALVSNACMKDFSEDFREMYDASDIAAFPDPIFTNYCLEHFDSTGPDGIPDGILSESEIQKVKSIDCRGLGIRDIAGIQFFVNLDSLDCSGNSISYLPVNDLVHLKYLNCSGNQINELDLFTTEVSSLYCCPMKDSEGNNTLKYVYIRRGQEIEYVTRDRDKADPKRIPDETMIIAIPESKDESAL